MMHLSSELHVLHITSGPVRVETLLQTLNAHPGLLRAERPPRLLAPEEEIQYAALRVAKRRRDWLLGRWTAKHLLQDHLQRTTGRVVPLDCLQIGQDPDGAPFAALTGPPSERLALSLSISHSGDRALCALTEQPGVSVGADTEMVRCGLDEMARQFCAAEELAWLDSLEPGTRPVGIIAVWSAKEAVLKALRIGLRADTRRIICIPEQAPRHAGWTPIDVRCDDGLLGAERVGEVASWCRSSSDYVECLALRSG